VDGGCSPRAHETFASESSLGSEEAVAAVVPSPGALSVTTTPIDDMSTLVIDFLFLYLFLMIFQKYVSHFKFCKSILPPSYDTTFGSNRHMVERLEVLSCSNCRITRWL
jgi:hypothetical protein